MSEPLPIEDVHFNTVPVSSLNISSRMKLSKMLNPKQALTSSGGTARDYRGLAELMQFDWNDIQNFQRHEDPTMKLLEAWTANSNNTLGILKKFLEDMERYDVIEDCLPQFKKDALVYLSKRSNMNPIQVPEVTSCRPLSSQMENPCALTVGDAQTGACTYYDAYVCYADEDLEFVWRLAEFLESNAINMKLFIKGRDLLAGTSEPDSYVRLIHERCRRMLIILSPVFLSSPACEFQTSFAAGLAMEEQCRRLIPLIYKPCTIPLILRYVSKIDFTRPNVPLWLWDKLIQSIRGTSSSAFISSLNTGSETNRLAGPSTSKPELEGLIEPVITFPPSGQYFLTSSSTMGPDATIPALLQNEEYSLQSCSSAFPLMQVGLVQRSTPPPKQKLLGKLIKRFTSSTSSTGNIPASSSNVTSGYQTNSFISMNSENDERMNTE